jgi:uncharacterized membrane protein YedE/YeeE
VDAALIGLVTGAATGVVMTRWGLCFNRGVRRAFFEGRPRVLRAFAIAVAVQLLALPLLVALGVGPLERSTEAGGIALLPVAQLAGGLAFGAGMALAGGCVTGMLWKAGGGTLALAVAIAGFAAGELLIRGPGADVPASLADASRPRTGGLPELLGDGAELVPVGDAAALAEAVAGLLADPERARRLAEAGTRQAATWPDEAATARQLVAVYRELLGPPGAGAR